MEDMDFSSDSLIFILSFPSPWGDSPFSIVGVSSLPYGSALRAGRVALRTGLCAWGPVSAPARNGTFQSRVLEVLQQAPHPAGSGTHHGAPASGTSSSCMDAATPQAPAVFCDFVRSQQLAGLA